MRLVQMMRRFLPTDDLFACTCFLSPDALVPLNCCAVSFQVYLCVQDIFTFIEDGMECGVPVMRYATDRARNTWPREVIPRSGWYSTPQPTACFGGYTVQTLPTEDLRWYMCQSFGLHWDTHDWLGEPLNPWALECRRHSKFLGMMVPKPKSLVQKCTNSSVPHYMLPEAKRNTRPLGTFHALSWFFVMTLFVFQIMFTFDTLGANATKN